MVIELEAHRQPYFAIKQYVEDLCREMGYTQLIDTGEKWIACDCINCHCMELGKTMAQCADYLDELNERFAQNPC